MLEHVITAPMQCLTTKSNDTARMASHDPVVGHVLEQQPVLTLCDLLQQFYSDVRVIAHARLRRLPPSRTLHTSTVLQEAILRLVKRKCDAWQNHVYFFADIKQAVQQVVADYVRHKFAHKRDVELVYGDTLSDQGRGAGPAGDFIAAGDAAAATPLQKLAVHRALEKLQQEHPRAAQVVFLRFLIGLTTSEIAEAMSRSTRGVERDWVFARSWLEAELRVA